MPVDPVEDVGSVVVDVDPRVVVADPESSVDVSEPVVPLGPTDVELEPELELPSSEGPGSSRHPTQSGPMLITTTVNCQRVQVMVEQYPNGAAAQSETPVGPRSSACYRQA